MRKGEVTLKILELIAETAKASVDIMDAILSSGYGASYSKMQYSLKQKSYRKSQEEINKQRTQNYYNILYRLRKDNLIIEKEEGGKRFFRATSKGLKKILLLKETLSSSKNLPSKYYKKENQSFFTIVVFDVPEKERRSRDWLREVLKNLGFQMIQKSVWLGKIKIPKELLNDIFKLKLENFVEIFEISKAGSLKQLT